MAGNQVPQQLEEAGASLTSAIHSLTAFHASPDEAAASLARTAQILQTINTHEMRTTAGVDLSRSVRSLQEQAQLASALLESAAALRFGSFLSNGTFSGGYQTSGAIDQFGGGGFQIEA